MCYLYLESPLSQPSPQAEPSSSIRGCNHQFSVSKMHLQLIFVYTFVKFGVDWLSTSGVISIIQNCCHQSEGPIFKSYFQSKYLSDLNYSFIRSPWTFYYDCTINKNNMHVVTQTSQGQHLQYVIAKHSALFIQWQWARLTLCNVRQLH